MALKQKLHRPFRAAETGTCNKFVDKTDETLQASGALMVAGETKVASRLCDAGAQALSRTLNKLCMCRVILSEDS